MRKFPEFPKLPPHKHKPACQMGCRNLARSAWQSLDLPKVYEMDASRFISRGKKIGSGMINGCLHWVISTYLCQL